MVINFSNVNYKERPVLILKNAGGTPLGVLGYAENIAPDVKYNETSSIEFEIPAYVDGAPVPYYDDVVGMRVIELKDIGQFTLVKPETTSDGITEKKNCKGYSLEYEFAYKKITLEEGTYKFFDMATPKDTLLGRIMELMPGWSVGEVSKSLMTKYRTFKASNENLYTFMKGAAQQSYTCIFHFDTLNRIVHVRDANEEPQDTPVFLAHHNLAKEIILTENTEDVYTRLDVSGAEGVNIRDVNPAGTNKLINLGYYMTPDNFDQALIDKYNGWKKMFDDNKRSYYLLSIQYSLKISEKTTEQAVLTDLKGELTSLENIQAVTIQAIAQGISVQGDLDEANKNIADKKEEIAAKEAQIASIEQEASDIFGRIKAIRDACSFDAYFTKDEHIQMDRYIRDTEVADPTFVYKTTESYTTDAKGSRMDTLNLSFNDCEITTVTDAVSTEIYEITGGSVSIGGMTEATLISAIVEHRDDGSMIASIHAGFGKIEGTDYPSACITLTGTWNGGSAVSDFMSAAIHNAYVYFTLDATEYEKRSVAWELFEYGYNLLSKISVPPYTFKITSANFFSIDEFMTFKNALRIGERIMIEIKEGQILRPIFIGVKFEYSEPESIELMFSDSYASGDSTFRLVDMLEKSISMGRNLDVSKYIYSSFTDSGADTGIKTFMNSALDVSKNAIISSTGQAVSWDAAGIRLRKYANDAQTAFEDEQIWMNNNSILMTDDNWSTAKMAIGKFHDDNLGDCWGIVADRIVGTLLAGSSMILESEKKDGGTAVFRMDSDGCRLYNSDFRLMSGTTEIMLNPEIGMAIGSFPLAQDTESGRVLNEENAKFWVDADGNVHIKGTLHGVDGEFTGYLKCISKDGAYFQVDGTTMGFYDKDGSPMLDYGNGEMTLYGAIYAKGKDGAYFRVDSQAMGFYDKNGNALLDYNNGSLTLTGGVNATSLNIVNKNGTSTIDAYIGSHDSVVAAITATEQLGNRLNEAEQLITPEAIVNTVTSSKVYQDDVKNIASAGDIEALEQRINSAEQKMTSEYIMSTVTESADYLTLKTTVTQTATGLSSKVEANGIISAINQSAEDVEILAERIKLEGTVTANGYFKVLTDGSVEAVNGYFSGTFRAGHWTFDSNGATYRPNEGSSNYLRIYSDGNFAYYDTYGMPARYGANASYPTNIYGNFIRLTPASADCGIVVCNSASTYNQELGIIEYEDPSIICDGATNGDKDNDWYPTSCGNIGTRYKRWDIGWIRLLHLGDTPDVSSTRRVKHDIVPLPSMGSAIDALEPVSFVYNWEKTGRPSYGLILEDTIDILPDICSPADGDGYEGGIKYEMLIPVLLKEIQELRKRVLALEAA